MIFRGGSGSGINLSNIRGSMEHLAKGGTASGPVSFMRGADSWAGTIKSGGKTRRAAKMVVLDVDHPDIREFIWCKAREEDKAQALRDAGFDMSIDGDGFKSIQYQNANNSVRVTDEFMRAVERGRRVAPDRPHDRRAGGRWWGSRSRARADARDRRGRLALRGPGRAVRHDDQPLAHLPRLGPDQRVQPVQRVHARRRLRLQPRVAEPDEVPPRRRHARRRVLRARRRHHAAGAGDRRRALQLPDRGDRRQRARVPPARPGLRQPRRLPDEQRHALRLRPRSRHGGGDHRADDRTRLPRVGARRRRARPLRALRREPRRAQRRDGDAPRRRVCDPETDCADTELLAAARRSWDEAVELGERAAIATPRRRCSRRPGRSAS